MNAARLIEQVHAAGGQIEARDGLTLTVQQEAAGDQIRPDAERIEDTARHFAYRFRLHGAEGGGTFISPSATLEEARAELLRVYGGKLALVAKATRVRR